MVCILDEIEVISIQIPSCVGGDQTNGRIRRAVRPGAGEGSKIEVLEDDTLLMDI